MCSDDGQHTFPALIIAREEVLSGLQQSREGGKEFAVRDFATELATLRQAMRKEAEEPFHDRAVAEVGEAQEAAQNHDGPRALQHLKNAGPWALDVATKIGVNLATEVLKKAFGS
jgi:hypothetical protein